MGQREEASDTRAGLQGHVHEILGSVKTAEREDPHGHRFCTVTGEAIPSGANDHVHEVSFITDYYDNHYHGFTGRTGGAVQVNDRHVHYIKAATSVDDNHSHEFEAATMINDPTGSTRTREAASFEEEYPYEDKFPYNDEDFYDDNYFQYREDNYHRY